MKTFIMIAVAAIGLAAIDVRQAEANGFHFRAGGVHVDVGHPHHGHGYYGGYRGYYPRYYSGYRGHGHGHSHWHDTSHWDYHPGGYVRHYNHYHYVPGHYDFHRDGHWHHH